MKNTEFYSKNDRELGSQVPVFLHVWKTPSAVRLIHEAASITICKAALSHEACNAMPPLMRI